MMKKLWPLFLFVLLISCQKNIEPKDVAKKFVENIAAGNHEEAKKYATASTQLSIDIALSYGAENTDPDFKFNFVKDSIVQDKAWVFFEDQNHTENNIILRKVKDRWLVSVGFDELE